jgi:DNA-binding NtrC family response regulator
MEGFSNSSVTNHTQPVVLVVDDDEGIRDTLEVILNRDYKVVKAADSRTALRIVDEKEVQVMLLDIRLPDISGLDVLKRVKERYDDIEIVMITAVKEIDTAVKAMKLGAYDYITKEFDYDEVANLVRHIVEKQNLTRELVYLQTEMNQYIQHDFVMGKSLKMRQVYDVVEKIAKIPANILITGETGTGKEVLGRFIHRTGSNPDGPFVASNLASIPYELLESTLFGHEKGAFTGAHRRHHGKFELAGEGTLFLDEISELKYDLQAKILRAIQEGEIERVGGNRPISINVRIIAATNIDLEQAVRKGAFREDLYYRLNVIPIKIPPLRERRVDIPDLINFFMGKYNKKFNKKVTKITNPALRILFSFHWPGNVRELENLIERLVATIEGDTINESHIPIEYYFSDLESNRDGSMGEDFLRKACDTFERNFILKALERAKWSRKEAAKNLGLPLSTFKYKLAKLNIYDFLHEKKDDEAEE